MTIAKRALFLGLVPLLFFGCVPSPLSGPEPQAQQTEEFTLLTAEELRAKLAGDSLLQPPLVHKGTSDADSVDIEAVGTESPDSVVPQDSLPPKDTDPRPSTYQARWIHNVEDPRMITVSFWDDPIVDVLTLFSSYAGTSILMSDEPEVRSKRITGDLRDLPWHIALETILRAHGLRAVQDPLTGIIVVQTEARALLERDPEIIRLRYVYAEDVLPTLERIIDGGGSSGDMIQPVRTGPEKSNTLLVYTSPEKMVKVREMVDKIDRKRPTVMIEAKLVFLNRSSLERMGFTYSILPNSYIEQPGGGTGDDDDGDDDSGEPVASVRPIFPNQGPGMGGIPGFPNPIQNNNSTFSLLHQLALSKAITLNVFFDIMQGTGLAEVQAAPNITTISDLEAVIQVGEFFILPNDQPILTATGGTAPSFGGYPYPPGGMLPGQYPQVPGQMIPGQQNTGMNNPYGYNPYGYSGYGYPSYGGYSGYGYPPYGGLPAMGGAASQGWGSFQTATTLRVTPYVLPNGRVRMRLSLSRDGGTLAPDGKTITGGSQSTQTEVIVRNNESIVIGGLTVVEQSQSVTGIPFLKDLPLIGALFRTKQQARLHQDLIIIVTPHVVYDEDDDIQH